MSTLHLAGRANGTINEWISVRHSPEKFLQVFNRRVYIVKKVGNTLFQEKIQDNPSNSFNGFIRPCVVEVEILGMIEH